MKEEAKMFGIAALAIGAWEGIKYGVKAIRNRRNQQVQEQPVEQPVEVVQEKPETSDPQPEDKK